MSDVTAAGMALPSRESALLDRLEEQTRWGIAISVISFAVGVLTLISFSSSTALILGGLAVFCGPCMVWSFLRYMRLLAQARELLKLAPLDLLLERRFKVSRIESFPARLWALDSQERPLAWFSSVQWSVPLFMTGYKMPAKVYGAPTRRAVVAVSCSKGLLVGRINMSHFDEDRPSRSLPRSVSWLLKPRRLPLSRR
jgi:hypothetical protein